MTPDEKKQLDIICQAALSNGPTLYFSFEAAEKCILDKIPGDFVECGVYAGAQCAAMALACRKHGAMRKIHLFDSFKGIPRGGHRDPACLTGQSVSSLENTKHFMAKWGIDESRLVYHPGWFRDTIPVSDIGDIAILRLDADLYRSTKIALEHFYPKLVHDGFCIVDDWSLKGCCAAVCEYFAPSPSEIAAQLGMKRISGDDGPTYFRKEQ